MATPEHLSILRQGVKAWNNWRKSSVIVTPDLSDADLSWANLKRANLKGAELSGANLFNADLNRADLRGAILNGANINGANLIGTNFSWAMLRETNLNDANLRGADLTGADLGEAILHHATLVQADVTDARIDSCHVYGISVWDLKGKPTSQLSLVITPYGAPSITVDDLEVAQFICLLLKHEKLRSVINAVTQRGVLMLGRFSEGGLELLRAVAQRLREEKYLPIIFDFDRPDGRDYTETVKTLVGLSRFVIVDLSGPSVPQELYATVPHFDIPFVPIIQAGRDTFSMVRDLFMYPWFLSPIIEFGAKEELIELMPSRIISPAEERHKERQRLLDRVFKAQARGVEK